MYEINEIANILDEHDSIFYKVWEMGRPEFTDSIPTAAVAFNKAGNFIAFKFNPTFFNELSAYERAFIVAHESLHIILNHGKRFQKIANPEIANMAQDIAIHEIMFNNFFFDKTQLKHKIFNNFCERSIINEKFNIQLPPNQSSEVYYQLLLKEQEGSSQSCSEGTNGLHGEIDCDIDIEVEANEELQNKLKNEKTFESKIAGDTPTGTKIRLHIKPKRKKKWESIIIKWYQKNISFDEEEQWAIKNPRLGLLPDMVMLPHNYRKMDENKHKKNIFLFQDTSGSCVNLAERFLQVARSIPLEHFNVRFFCFDTQVYETNYMKGELQGFGGTSFSCISKFVDTQPEADAYFIITDGYGDNVKPVKADKWFWLLSSDYTQCIPKESKVYKLEEFE